MSEDTSVTVRLREEVEAARTELDSSRKALLEACKLVPDIGLLSPDGDLLWRRATERCNQAVQVYGEALARFSENLLGPKGR